MKRVTVVITLCVLLAASTAAIGAQDIFLKIEGIAGTADCPGHRDFIKAQSVILAPNSDDGQGNISITKRFDSASPKLARHADRKTVTTAEMHICCRPEGEKTCIMSFEGVNITDVERGGISEFQSGLLGGNTGTDIEQISLQYNKMEWIHQPEAQAVSMSNPRNVFAEFGGRRIPLAAFGIGASGSDSRVGIVAEKTPPSGLLSGDHISAVGLVLMGEDGPHHLLSTGRAGVAMSGTINPAHVGIVSDNDPLFGVILSPASITFGS